MKKRVLGLGLAWMVGSALVLPGSTAFADDKAKDKTSAKGSAKSGGDASLKGENDQILYTVGYILARQGGLTAFKLKPEELEVVKRGIDDAVLNVEPKVKLEEVGPKIEPWAKSRVEAGASTEKDKGKAFTAKAAAEPGAQKTNSGLVYKETKAGTGDSPAASDEVTVNYTGKLIDGTVFDSSAKHGQAATFTLNQVIPCWTEGVQKMKTGGSARLVCPSDIAYGDGGRPPVIPGGATLVFDIDLISVKKGAAPPAGGVTPK
jgi:FKBP-type peptidyl-prolyl cis-trans isomerase FkpA